MADRTFQEMLTTVGFACVPVSAEFLAWLETTKAPRVIIDLLAPGLPARQKRRRRLRDCWDLHTESEIRKEAEEFHRYLKAGLLSLGSCLNGDPFALDIRKEVGSIGYISHDKVWEDEEARIRNHFILVAPSLADFVHLACDNRLPIDYFEAKSWDHDPPHIFPIR